MRYVTLTLLLVTAGACGWTGSARDDSGGTEQAPAAASLDSILSCNDRRVGGDALRSIRAVEYDLHIVEPTFEVDATYRAERAEGTAGIARIDIYAGGERVFSEGWDGESGWQWPGDAAGPEPTSPEGGAALLHGLQQPGHFWTLADMEANGHTVERRPELDGESGGDTWALHLTLSDGFEVWYWVDRESCQVVRRRDFRAFHPDMDPTRTWIETHSADFRTTDGVTRSWRTLNVDRLTGDTLGVTTLRAVRVER